VAAAALSTTAALSALSACSAPATDVAASLDPGPPPVAEAPALVEPGATLERLPGARRERERGQRPGLRGLAGLAEKKAGLARPIRIGGTLLARPSAGRSGTGLRLGYLDPVTAPVGGPVDQQVRVSVANIPDRTSTSGFQGSMRAISADGQDFVLLNEVGTRDTAAIEAAAPGYAAYRDPVRDTSPGGSESMNNVVMWRSDRWGLVDAGRVKVVDDDRGYNRGQPFLWDRYLTWAVLQDQGTGAIVSVVSLHMPTNPAKAPAQPGNPGQTRVQRYDDGMDRVLGVVRALQAHGPVLLGGDMNAHPTQGSWTAPAKMGTLGYGYAKDSGVMYLFHAAGTEVLAARQLRIASDHPALVVDLDLAGAGPVS
jgi:endonuclease/exonuclease/phosphatase family metal-dependent hydrolase